MRTDAATALPSMLTRCVLFKMGQGRDRSKRGRPTGRFGGARLLTTHGCLSRLPRYISFCHNTISSYVDTNDSITWPLTMSIISYVRTRYLAWSNSTPLPDLAYAPPPVFQHWHAFDKETCKWAPIPSDRMGTRVLSHTSTASQRRVLQLVTWNVDAFGDKHEARISGILSKLQQISLDGCGPDVIFFQEVSRKALARLLQAAWVRENWVSSEADETNWVDVPFAAMTLISRSFSGVPSPTSEGSPEVTSTSAFDAMYELCPAWRVKYPSRFKRDALCCDILWDRDTRIRLVNVHLDSLPIQPNQRPHQVATAASLLRTPGVGCGVIAGDWNPVSEQDMALLQENGLVDAWERLHPGEDGFTWGLDGDSQPFPPARLDKVAMLGLKPLDIQILHPETSSATIGSENELIAGNDGEGVPWSDHSGLLCSLILDDERRG